MKNTPGHAASSDDKEAGSKIYRVVSYPDPFVVAAHAEHKQTLILLHGRGSNGEKFGKEFLDSRISRIDSEGQGSATLHTTFRNMKFIFPTAKKRRARWYNRATINQWFDNVPIDEQDSYRTSREEEEWQLEGLKQSREYLKWIVDEEVNLLGAENVFIGGLSQGCAMSLHFLLSYMGTGKPLAGFLGMSGWLPFTEDVERFLLPQDSEQEFEDGDEDDLFATPASESDSATLPIAVQVCNYIRDNMDLAPIIDSRQPICVNTPVFLGHGTGDNKVKVARGRQAAELLRTLGVHEVHWKEYDEGHWYKVPEELDDIVELLQSWLTPR